MVLSGSWRLISGGVLDQGDAIVKSYVPGFLALKSLVSAGCHPLGGSSESSGVRPLTWRSVVREIGLVGLDLRQN